MKYFLCIISIFLFVSCSDPQGSEGSVSAQFQFKDTVFAVPSNPNNPYDPVGATYYNVMIDYYLQESFPQNNSAIASKVVSLALEDSSFVSMGFNYQFKSLMRVEYLISQGENGINSVVTNAIDNQNTAQSFELFLVTTLQLSDSEEEFESIYNYILGYEASLLADTNLSTLEKEKLLISTSIIRHTVYAKKKKPKKNKDPDWDLLVSSFIGAVDGADVSMQEAIVRSLVAGIIENK